MVYDRLVARREDAADCVGEGAAYAEWLDRAPSMVTVKRSVLMSFA